MADMPKPNTTRKIKLERMDKPRTVKVISVNVAEKTALVEYPGSSPDGRQLIGDLRETVEWSDFIDE